MDAVVIVLPEKTRGRTKIVPLVIHPADKRHACLEIGATVRQPVEIIQNEGIVNMGQMFVRSTIHMLEIEIDQV